MVCKWVGANCAVLSCNSSGRTKGISILRAPTGNDKWKNNWQKNIINIVTEEHEDNMILEDRIDKNKIYMCGNQFP